MSDTIETALSHFEVHDPVLCKVARALPPLTPVAPLLPENYFLHLVETIISQQLSLKAADTIFARVRQSLELTPANLIKYQPEDLRRSGISLAKAKAILGLAQALHENPDFGHQFSAMDDDSVSQALVALPGIGPWTAQMFLMFGLARPDVFSPNDAGIKRAYLKLYGDLSTLEAQSLAWKPYRTTACRILWKSLDVASSQ